ncbi:PilZ domain-containing protein [Cohnella fermenti]|uniref:PilZ domain-containing protein n=1 Tax=Cohnella fermenti TaxID=2565925 RepID=A0A4S4BHN1_9BACL|nr:PilZ domain-containing protein [Cohnella fermenti]THF73000.1 PilZ domain-containing protein [Cohnella fermenti]
MSQEGAAYRKTMGGSDKEIISLKSLVHCRTVVEKANFVSTGIMTRAEGELFEIELSEFELFELGETVKLTIYSPVGIQSFQSIVFAKYDGAIAIIQPPIVNQRFQEKREFYRVEATGSVQIIRLVKENGEIKLLSDPLEARLRDISIGGVGLIMPPHEELSQVSRIGAIVQVGFAFACELEAVHRERRLDEMHYGFRMKVLDTEMLRPLRAFVLRHQVEQNIQSRSEESRKRQLR